jgi:hypothetical protein
MATFFNEYFGVSEQTLAEFALAMSAQPDIGEDEEERRAEGQAAPKRNQLSMDAVSCSSARSALTGEATVAPKRSEAFSTSWRSATSGAAVNLSTPVSNAHILRGTTEQRAAMMITAEAEAATRV